MKIFVAITNFNYGQYIGEAIESVLNQTYPNFQLVIVDDGSTDDSRAVIDMYASEHTNKITAIYKENGGQGSAFNVAYNLSEDFDIVTFLDADDYWFPNKLEEIVLYHKEFDVVEHSLETSLKTCLLKQTKNNLSERLKRYRTAISFAPTSGLSYKKSVLDSIFPIPEHLTRICADTYINLVAVYNGANICTLNQCLGFYRIHSDNNWFNNIEKYKSLYEEYIAFFNEKLKLINQPPIPTYEKAIYNGMKDVEYLLSVHNKIAVYGMGFFGKVVAKYLSENQYEIVCFLQTYQDHQKESFFGKRIYGIHEIMNTKQMNDIDTIVIATSFKYEVILLLEKLGIQKQIISFDI
ncbi:glycosyltransferase [Sporosarcina sp. FSL K6-3457]|uniref:glycosyltransferase n=1 Tax=Sporosarcina sp. FSL K6-3457 TaxID=2978204 RepID=UPI0030F8BF06